MREAACQGKAENPLDLSLVFAVWFRWWWRAAPSTDRRMRLAVAGCCHGELDKICETLALAERRGPGRIDILLCCGDFQAVRNEADLRCMAVPPKYRHMQTFHRVRTRPCPRYEVGQPAVGAGFQARLPTTDQLSLLVLVSRLCSRCVSMNWRLVNVTFLLSILLFYLFRKGSFSLRGTPGERN